MTDRCSIARCRAEAELIYLGHGLCERHWNQFTAEDVPADRLRVVLGLGAGPVTATEEPMATNKKTAKKKATSKKATPKAAKPKKEKAPKEDLVVFAFRLTEAERTAIHKTAGPRNATQLVRRVATAFANEDEAAFRAVLKDARSARS